MQGRFTLLKVKTNMLQSAVLTQSHENMEPSGHKIQENRRNRFKILVIKQLLAERLSAPAFSVALWEEQPCSWPQLIEVGMNEMKHFSLCRLHLEPRRETSP